MAVRWELPSAHHIAVSWRVTQSALQLLMRALPTAESLRLLCECVCFFGREKLVLPRKAHVVDYILIDEEHDRSAWPQPEGCTSRAAP